VTRHLRRWGAVWILLALWLVFGIVQWFTNLHEYAAEQASHGEAFEWPGAVSYFVARVAENHASESWQLAVEAILIMGLSSVLFTKGEEDTRRIEGKLDEITRRLDQQDHRARD
jgi:low affinity Fe/Cu permease